MDTLISTVFTPILNVSLMRGLSVLSAHFWKIDSFNWPKGRDLLLTKGVPLSQFEQGHSKIFISSQLITRGFMIRSFKRLSGMQSPSHSWVYRKKALSVSSYSASVCSLPAHFQHRYPLGSSISNFTDTGQHQQQSSTAFTTMPPHSSEISETVKTEQQKKQPNGTTSKAEQRNNGDEIGKKIAEEKGRIEFPYGPNGIPFGGMFGAISTDYGGWMGTAAGHGLVTSYPVPSSVPRQIAPPPPPCPIPLVADDLSVIYGSNGLMNLKPQSSSSSSTSTNSSSQQKGTSAKDDVSKSGQNSTTAAQRMASDMQKQALATAEAAAAAGDGPVQQMPSNCSAFSSPKTTAASVPSRHYGQATALASSAPLLMPSSCSGGTVFNASGASVDSNSSTTPSTPSTAFNFAIQHHQLGALSGGKRKRRHRTIFTEEQLIMLEESFHVTQYPDVSVRERLAEKCNLREERVEVWFKNRHAKLRKRNREVQQHPQQPGSEPWQQLSTNQNCPSSRPSSDESLKNDGNSDEDDESGNEAASIKSPATSPIASFVPTKRAKLDKVAHRERPIDQYETSDKMPNSKQHRIVDSQQKHVPPPVQLSPMSLPQPSPAFYDFAKCFGTQQGLNNAVVAGPMLMPHHLAQHGAPAPIDDQPTIKASGKI